MNLPNLLVIGTMKAGSTSLHHYLNHHPDIYMSEMKEINFFIEELNWKKGLQWYSSHFPSKIKYRGESSIGYTKEHEYPRVPEKIHDVLGKDTKFIYILRNPIDRAISHFIDDMLYRQMENGKYPEINESLLEPGNKYVETSKYYQQLLAYLDYFKLSNFHFVDFESFQNNPLYELNRICDFLELDEFPAEFVPPQVFNKTEDKGLKTEQAKRILNNSVAKFLKSIIPVSLAHKLVGSAAYQRITKKPITKNEYQLDERTLDYLRKEFYSDTKSFQILTGKNFLWKGITQSASASLVE